MAARDHQAPIVPQKQRDVQPIAKQKAAPRAEGKNRQALGDIGNVVNQRAADGKLQPPIHCPVTRSFGAQLLASAQKQIANLNEGAGKGYARAAKSKVTVRHKPVEVIEISPDTNAEINQASANKARASLASSSKKKKVHTLTSVLTARSKAACGVIDKPKDLVHDIDALDHDDQLAVTDYVEDIYKFYKLSENWSRPRDYMNSQAEINPDMRAILADWIIDVHQRFKMKPETLYLTFYIIDHYLSLETVPKIELQLVGLSAMLIACKYEEIWSPVVNNFVCISKRAYSREQILAKEKGILNKIEWSLTVPTPYVFLVRFFKAGFFDKEMEHMAFFFVELGLMEYSMIMHCPSVVAAAAVYAARCTLEKSPLWSETLKWHTGFSEPELLGCARILVSSHLAAPESKLQVVYKKYSSPQFGAVALHTPAAKLLDDLKILGA